MIKQSKSRFLILLLSAILLCAQSANALPVGDKTLYESLGVPFSLGKGFAQVDCEVYQYTTGSYAGKYVYAYQISNLNAGIGISFFSVEILEGATAESASYDQIVGTVDPIYWTIISSPPQIQSVEALFANTLDNGETSARLWFASNYAPSLGSGALFGRASLGMEEVVTPIPEPSTLILLGSLVGLANFKRKKMLCLK